MAAAKNQCFYAFSVLNWVFTYNIVKNYSVFYSAFLLNINCYSEWLFPQFTVNCCYFYINFRQMLCFLQCEM